MAHHCSLSFERNHEFCVAFYADVIDEYHTLVFVFIDETDVDFLACIFSEVECEVFPFACESLAATRLEFLVHDHLSVGTIVFHNAVGESVDHLLVFPDDNLELVAGVVESLSVESEHALVVRDVELWCRHPVVRLALVGIDRVRSCGIICCSVAIAQREVPWSVVGIKFECSHFSGRSIVVAFIEEDLSKCR